MTINNVSIITVNYNTSELVHEIEKFSRENGIEFIVVDNSLNFEPQYEETILVSPNDNIGFGAACNLGADNSSREILLFLNPDARIKLNELKQLLSVKVEKHSIWGPAIPTQSNHYNVLERSSIPGVEFERVKKKIPNQEVSYKLMSMSPTVFVSGACLFIFKKRFDELGGFDRNIFLYAEDLDLCLRNGSNNYIFPSVVIEHIGGESSKQKIALLGKLKRLKRSYDGHYSFFSHRSNFFLAFFNALYLASGVSRKKNE